MHRSVENKLQICLSVYQHPLKKAVLLCRIAYTVRKKRCSQTPTLEVTFIYENGTNYNQLVLMQHY